MDCFASSGSGPPLTTATAPARSCAGDHGRSCGYSDGSTRGRYRRTVAPEPRRHYAPITMRVFSHAVPARTSGSHCQYSGRQDCAVPCYFGKAWLPREADLPVRPRSVQRRGPSPRIEYPPSSRASVRITGSASVSAHHGRCRKTVRTSPS